MNRRGEVRNRSGRTVGFAMVLSVCCLGTHSVLAVDPAGGGGDRSSTTAPITVGTDEPIARWANKAVSGVTGSLVRIADLKKGEYNALQYSNAEDKVLYYSLYLPATYTPTSNLPFLVDIHGGGPVKGGKGEGGAARKYLATNTSYTEAKYPCVFFEPYANPEWCKSCWDEKGWGTGPHRHDMKTPPAGIALILEVVPQLLRDLGCDTNRCYVAGESNGGYATWDLILYRPDLFAAAVPICGAGDPSQVWRITNMPLWAFHGTADKWVPFLGTKDMIDALEKVGGKPKYTYIEGGNHHAWDPAWANPELVPWLFSQNKARKVEP